MRYLQQNRRKGKKAVLVLFTLILLFIVLSFLWPSLIPGKFNTIGKPLWKLREITVSTFGEMAGVLNSKSSLVLENKELKKEAALTEIKLLQSNLILKENAELKEILGRRSVGGFLLSRVLSKPPQSPYDSLIIDVGSKNVKKGQEVFVLDSVLIGRIEEVFGSTAKVRLLSSPGNKYQVQIGEENIVATAEGLGGGNFKISLPRGVDIAVGDVVVSPSLNVTLLGIVEEIDTTEQNSFQNVLFKSPINITQVKWVQVKIINDG